MSSPEHCLTRRLAPPVARRSRAVLAGQEGLEPPTAGFGDRNSSQLSYCPVPACAGMHGPLVNLHQMQKCTWPWPRRRTASDDQRRDGFPAAARLARRTVLRCARTDNDASSRPSYGPRATGEVGCPWGSHARLALSPRAGWLSLGGGGDSLIYARI